ncbi:MAG TPA: isochorismatase family protein [Gammaproteobacteria bacterium]|nr:isochorismatase family protein [Gammaproteobacteria bacterium]
MTLPTPSNDGLCRHDASQLVVIDLQEKLGAAMPEKVINRVIKNTVLLLSAATRLGIPVIVTEQYPKGLGTLLPGIGSAVPAQSRRLEKTCFSCVAATGFEAVSQNTARPQIVVAGMEAHVCVLQTAFDLHAAGRQVFVVEDAVCSRRLENYESAINRLRHGGVTVTNSESVVFEWLRDAQHAEFKSLSAILR